MGLRPVFALALALPGTVSGAGTSHCSQLDNDADMGYSLDLRFGTPGQSLRAIPDSGSSELVVLAKGAECTKQSLGCAKHKSFDASKSSSGNTVHARLIANYGQGETSGEVYYDNVNMAGMSIKNQSAMLMDHVGLENFGVQNFDAILGLGVRKNARYGVAEGDLSLLSSMAKQYHFDATVGLCFGMDGGSLGRLDLGNGIPNLNYVDHPIRSEGSTWSLALEGVAYGHDVPGDEQGATDESDVKIRSDAMVSLSSASGKKKGELPTDKLPAPVVIAECSHGGCDGLVDSGTSLISLPSPMVSQLDSLIGMVASDCSNMNDLPDLHLKLNGKWHSIPSQVYVGAVKPEEYYQAAYRIPEARHLHEWGNGAFKAVVHRHHHHQSKARELRLGAAGHAAELGAKKKVDLSPDGLMCTPLFMEAGEGMPFSQLVILGMPFFRAYAGRFNRDKRTIGLAKIPVDSKLCSTCDDPPKQVSLAHAASLRGKAPAGTTLLPALGEGEHLLAAQGDADRPKRPRRIAQASLSKVRVPHFFFGARGVGSQTHR